MTEPSTDEREALLADNLRAIVHHSHGEDHTVQSLVSWLTTGRLLATRPAADVEGIARVLRTHRQVWYPEGSVGCNCEALGPWSHEQHQAAAVVAYLAGEGR